MKKFIITLVAVLSIIVIGYVGLTVIAGSANEKITQTTYWNEGGTHGETVREYRKVDGELILISKQDYEYKR